MSSRHPSMIVLVATELIDQMTLAEQMVINSVARQSAPGPSSSRARDTLNDLDDYRPVVECLDALAMAVLVNASTGSRLHPKLDGARIDLSGLSPTMRAVDECSAYLTGTAAPLLADSKGLSRYSLDAVNRALDLLAGLHGFVMKGIIDQAAHDLNRLRTLGILNLAKVAHVVAVDTASAAGRTAD